MSQMVAVKRVYEDASPNDGSRVLVDRLWPRGVSRGRANLTLWDKEVAPSDELRKWYQHDPAKFEEFTSRYKEELSVEPKSSAFGSLAKLAEEGKVTLLTGSKAVQISDAAVLAGLLNSGWKPSS